MRCHSQTPCSGDVQRRGSTRLESGVPGARCPGSTPALSSHNVTHTESSNKYLYGQMQLHTTASQRLSSGYKTNQYQLKQNMIRAFNPHAVFQSKISYLYSCFLFSTKTSTNTHMFYILLSNNKKNT